MAVPRTDTLGEDFWSDIFKNQTVLLISEATKLTLGQLETSLQNIETHHECLVDTESSVQDVQRRQIKLKYQAYLFYDRLLDSLPYMPWHQPGPVGSTSGAGTANPNRQQSTPAEPERGRFLPIVHPRRLMILDWHMEKALRQFSILDNDYQLCEEFSEKLAKSCSVKADKIKNDRGRFALVAIAGATISISTGAAVSLVTVPACMPASVAGTVLLTLPGVGAKTTVATVIRVGAGVVTALLVAACFCIYKHYNAKCSRLIKSFTENRQLLDKCKNNRTELYTACLCIKTRLEAVKESVRDILIFNEPRLFQKVADDLSQPMAMYSITLLTCDQDDSSDLQEMMKHAHIRLQDKFHRLFKQDQHVMQIMAASGLLIMPESVKPNVTVPSAAAMPRPDDSADLSHVSGLSTA